MKMSRSKQKLISLFLCLSLTFSLFLISPIRLIQAQALEEQTAGTEETINSGNSITSETNTDASEINTENGTSVEENGTESSTASSQTAEPMKTVEASNPSITGSKTELTESTSFLVLQNENPTKKDVVVFVRTR